MEYLHKYHYTAPEDAAHGEYPPLSESPIWMLGQRYDPEDLGTSSLSISGAEPPPLLKQPQRQSEATSKENEFGTQSTVFTLLYGAEKKWAAFLAHFRSVLWCTYRAAFPRLGPTGYTSDMGWGCTLRTGQMVLAQALTRHLLGTGWRRQSDCSPLYTKMVQWFADDPKQPFSLHRIAHAGLKYGKNVGEWFGPSTMAQVLEELLKEFSPSGIRPYLCQDSCMYLDQVMRVATSTHWPNCDDDEDGGNQLRKGGERWAPLLVMVPLRLGLDKLNEDYIPFLKEVFRIPQSIGIAGGRPRASLYFVGIQDDHLFYLDPHTVQPASRFPECGDVPASEAVFDTYHCHSPLQMSIRDIDPSLCLAFYCRDRTDFEDLRNRAVWLGQSTSPVFTVAERTPDYLVRPKPPKHSEKLFSDDEDDVVFI